MPPVTVSQPPPDELRALSCGRWDELRAARPDLVPAVDLQQNLLGIVISTAQALKGKLPRLSLPPKYLAAKLARGVPILVGEPIPVPLHLLKSTFLRLCETLAAGGAGDAAEHIKQSVESGQMEAGSLLTASLSRNQDAIRTGAVHRGLAPDLVWLLAELAASPFAHALQTSLLAPNSEWNHGYCAACGSWPAMMEVVDGHRILRCSFCASAWERSDYSCTYCAESGETFVTAAPDPERIQRRLELCGACQGYLKTVDVPSLSPFPLLAIYDMETMDLDLAAMEHGYSRPPLRNFAGLRAKS
jgi:FdhE protein